MERVKGQIELFNLPKDAIPHSIIAFGYPDQKSLERPSTSPTSADKSTWQPRPPDFPKEKGAFEPGRVHYEKW